ncbi:MAG TPA: hypothetical protein VGV12_09125 [Gemmatimonadales bacterium]|nr:hypothetical protein [Gemmatimonadales bacterium]
MNTAPRATVLLLAMSALACSDRAPISADAPDLPTFDFADNPSSPSPIIIRRDGILVRVITVDLARNLMAIHGPVDVSPCTNLTTRDTVDGQQINTPSDAQAFRLLLQAPATHVEIYQGTDISAVFPFVAATFCAFVANTPTLYAGLAQYHVNLGSSMASFRWEGDVTRTSDGAPFHYVESQDVVTNGNGSRATSSFIQLQQTGQ